MGFKLTKPGVLIGPARVVPAEPGVLLYIVTLFVTLIIKRRVSNMERE